MGDNGSEFVRLMIENQSRLIKCALPLVGGQIADAEDVVQQAALTIWPRFKEYDGTRPFYPWASAFVQRAALEHNRKRHRYVFLTEELINLLAVEAQQEVETRGDQKRLVLPECLDALSTKDRNLIQWRYSNTKQTVKQLAESYRQKADAVYQRLARIRGRLARCVERRLLGGS